MRLEPGKIVDGWHLSAELGRGGNGEVWDAAHPDYGRAALKVLRNRSPDRRERFRQEISVMEAIRGRKGVLPLVAARAPAENAGLPVWLATPIAVSAADRISRAAGLAEAVDAGIAFAATLAGLAADGIHHRDVKPDNLFSLEDEWVVGDFGLAAFPKRAALTVPHKRLGPLYFIAPEMLRTPTSADPGPADVFSLAKTIWVLATGQRYPPEGQITPAVRGHDLRQWIDESGALALGLVLQDATAVAPSERPTMSELEVALRGWKQGGGRRDDDAVRTLQLAHVASLGELLAESIGENDLMEVEAAFSEMISTARERSFDKRREIRRSATASAEQARAELIREFGIKGVLRLHDQPWAGPVQDGLDVVEAVLRQPPGERHAELFRGWQVLMGRPLWWMHSLMLIASIHLRADPECEELATRIAQDEIRNHLFGFEDERQAAAWRLQKALVQFLFRVAPSLPLADYVRELKEHLSDEERLRMGLTESKLVLNFVREYTRRVLLNVDWWVAPLTEAAEQAESWLAATPVPENAEWSGPAHDLWLLSWEERSPMLTGGLAILAGHPRADDLLASPEIRDRRGVDGRH